ncbi:MAG: thioredoxin family protein, partial [Alphaproteobacteria bacterium]|nr:thioredoxin family protein [Alphaproteobacteria bacterium]
VTNKIKEQKNSSLELSLDIPMCSKICTIVSKKITITYYDTNGSSNSNNDSSQTKKVSLLFITLIAILGGLILNVMPCVLPVILMKLKSFAVQNNKIALAGTIVGNYVSFFAFSTFLAIIKASGEQIGWGMHFQNPVFLKVILITLFLLLLYSLEIFTLSPSIHININNKHKAFTENLISSIVASIIAIPCTAPFLGTAATFAIQGTSIEMFLIFFAVSTGFSLPYILAFFGKTFTTGNVALKSCGKYSVIVKNFASFGVFITLLWIIYLLSNHISSVLIFISIFLMLFSAWLFHIGNTHNNTYYNIVAFILLFSIMFLSPLNFKSSTHPKIQLPYKNSRISSIIDEHIINNRVVIINITAEWCLTCKYNELNVFNKKKIQKLIKEKNILFIEKDMTLKNDSLMKFISDHGRVGIPFTIIYGPHAKKGILLPEIFSIDELKTAISKAE